MAWDWRKRDIRHKNFFSGTRCSSSGAEKENRISRTCTVNLPYIWTFLGDISNSLSHNFFIQRFHLRTQFLKHRTRQRFLRKQYPLYRITMKFTSFTLLSFATSAVASSKCGELYGFLCSNNYLGVPAVHDVSSFGGCKSLKGPEESEKEPHHFDLPFYICSFRIPRWPFVAKTSKDAWRTVRGLVPYDVCVWEANLYMNQFSYRTNCKFLSLISDFCAFALFCLFLEHDNQIIKIGWPTVFALETTPILERTNRSGAMTRACWRIFIRVAALGLFNAIIPKITLKTLLILTLT